jgi:thiamine biosynthesis lipoprotein
MKKAIPILLCICMLAGTASGCKPAYQKYSYEFLNTFDTVIQIMGYCKSQSEFDGWAKKAEARFVELNRLFDMYNDYEGVNNIKTINDNAGKQPVAVAPEIVG